VTEAAAQTTKVEPASEFHVERKDEPDDLEALQRPQSEATFVSDTTRTGVRRKRKPKATESAGDAG
jgi:hypothetical protein